MSWLDDLLGRWFRPTPPSPPPTPPAGDGSIRLLHFHNIARGAAHPLRIEPKLEVTAGVLARSMAARGVLAHGDLEGRAAVVGYEWSALGENIAAGQATPKAAFDAWMSDPPHRRNILNPQFTDVGFASARDDRGTIFWVADFGRPL